MKNWKNWNIFYFYHVIGRNLSSPTLFARFSHKFRNKYYYKKMTLKHLTMNRIKIYHYEQNINEEQRENGKRILFYFI